MLQVGERGAGPKEDRQVDGAAQTVHEMPVSEKNKLGLVPQCELPVSAAYPKGTGPCDQLEAATLAAKQEAKAKEKAEDSPEALQVAADKAKEETKKDEEKAKALKAEQNSNKAKIAAAKAKLKELEGKQPAGKPGQSKNDVSSDPKVNEEVAKAKKDLKAKETDEAKIVAKQAKVADNELSTLMAQVANLPKGSAAREKVPPICDLLLNHDCAHADMCHP